MKTIATKPFSKFQGLTTYPFSQFRSKRQLRTKPEQTFMTNYQPDIKLSLIPGTAGQRGIEDKTILTAYAMVAKPRSTLQILWSKKVI